MKNPTRARSSARRLAELGLAVPQVVAHRVARMATAGPVLSARDRKEFSGMIAEKQLAFAQSWMAMYAETLRVQQTLLSSWLGSLASLPRRPTAAAQRRQSSAWAEAFLRVAGKGLAPVHRKAVANSKRLARTRLR